MTLQEALDKPSVHLQAYVSPRDLHYCRQLGGGNISEGVRKAIEKARENKEHRT